MSACSWCHRDGHEQPQCPIFPSPVCPACAGVGHTYRECPNMQPPRAAENELRPVLERIALELEIANRTRVLADFARLAAFDKKLPDVERARLDLNAALARRVP